MMDFAVVVSAVQQASHASRSVGSDLHAELARLRHEADAVLSGRWLGRAAEHFDRAWSEWDRGARELVRVLDELADALGASGAAYAEQDATGAQVLLAAAS